MPVCVRIGAVLFSALTLIGAPQDARAQITVPPSDDSKDWGWGTSPDAVPYVRPLPTTEATTDDAAESAPAQEKPTTKPAAVAEEKAAPEPETAPAAKTETKQEVADEPRTETAEEEPKKIVEEAEPKVEEAPKLEAKEEAEPAAEAETKTAEPAKEDVPVAAAPPELPKASTAATVSTTSNSSGHPFTNSLVTTYNTNPRIKAERQRQEATDESVAQAVSGFRPNLTGSYNRGRQRTSFDGADWSSSTSEDKGLTISQPLFRGFGTIAGYRSAVQRVMAGAYQLYAVEQQVLLEAIAAYMNVVANVSILDLARNNRDVLHKQLDASLERFNVGEVTRTDVAQSEARLSQAKTQVISSEGRLISSIAEYERVVGHKPEGQLVTPDNIPELPATLKEALAQARAANPELLSAVHAAKSSDHDVSVRKSVILPTVSLVGSMNRQEGAGVLGSSQFDQDSLTLQVSVPLYQSGAEYSRVREAKSVARQRKEESIDAGLAVDEAVTKAWEQLETAINTIRTREDQIKAAEIALEGVKQEQEYGARTILDVLDAEQELFNARTNLVTAQRDRVVASYNLLLNLGRLTPKNLELPVKEYDPSEHYDDIKWLPFGY